MERILDGKGPEALAFGIDDMNFAGANALVDAKKFNVLTNWEPP